MEDQKEERLDTGESGAGKMVEDAVNERMFGDFDYGDLSPRQSILLTFLISFVTGILTASIILVLYLHFIKPPPVRYYSFDLSKVITRVKTDIMKRKNNVSEKNIKGMIDRYISAVGSYVNFYAKRGIVFVGGATIGKSPYVVDITGGFYEYYKKAGR